tara:strand:- start:404 stop:1426 length:1023 start_codon:yes stop_codon:yes gene_type:complete
VASGHKIWHITQSFSNEQMKNMNSYLIADRCYTYATTIPEELSFKETQNYLFNLNHLTAVQISGDKAGDFLQGQLTCDVREVKEHTWQAGALCNLKGRIQALMHLFYQHHQYHLLLEHDLCDVTLTALSKTALLSKVALTPTAIQTFGLLINEPTVCPIALPKAGEVLTHQLGLCAALDSKRFLFICEPSTHKKDILNLFTIDEIQERGSLGWHYLALHAHEASIYLNTRASFLPQRLELPKKKWVSFDKGCYKGQEIIARLHYLAKSKHVLKLFHVETTLPCTPGDVLVDQDHAEMGEIIDVCPTHTGFLLLASVKLNHSLKGALQSNPQHMFDLALID